MESPLRISSLQDQGFETANTGLLELQLTGAESKNSSWCPKGPEFRRLTAFLLPRNIWGHKCSYQNSTESI